MKAHRLLRLYPPAWRDRYGEEFAALLAQQRLTPGIVLDVLRGALDAHLHPFATTGGIPPMAQRFRTTAITVFCAYIAFVVAGLSFYGMVDDSPFLPLRAHVPLFACWLLVEAGAAGALLAVAVGGLPVGLAVLRFALTAKRRDILLLLAIPFLALGVLGLFVLVVAAIAAGWLPFPWTVAMHPLPPGQPMPTGTTILGTTGIALFIVMAIASIVAVTLAVLRSEVHTQDIRAMGITIVVEPYRFARLPALIATLAMGLMLVGMLAFGVIGDRAVPTAFTVGVTINWLAIVAAMALATLVAAIAVRRDRAQRAMT